MTHIAAIALLAGAALVTESCAKVQPAMVETCVPSNPASKLGERTEMKDHGDVAAIRVRTLDMLYRQEARPQIPRIFRFPSVSTPVPAKSSKAFSVTRMIWSRTNTAPSAAPSSGCLMQHSHSTTAQPG